MTPPDPHPLDAALAAHAAREQARVLTPPPGFAERVTVAVLARPRTWPKWVAAGGGLTAVLLTAVVAVAVWPKPQPEPPPPPPVQPIVTPTPAPRIDDALSEAGRALAKLGRDTTDKATPPPALLAPVEAVKLPHGPPAGAGGQTAGATFAALPAAARSGLEPVTGRTKKAFGALLRDAGLRGD